MGLNSVPKITVFCVPNYVIFEKLPRYRKEESFLKNVGEFLQNYNALLFVSDFCSEHDKNTNGGNFFEVKIGLYYRTGIISVVK